VALMLRATAAWAAGWPRAVARASMAGLAAGFLVGVPALANEPVFFRIGTGGVNGSYYPVGVLVGSAISQPPGSRSCEDGGSCGVPNLVALAQSSSGSVENVRDIQSGKVPSGFAQADVANAAFTGTGAFAGAPPLTKLRALANLYPEQIHLVVRTGAAIESVGDLKGHRVSLDEPGSGTLIDARILLEAYGLTEGDVIAEYLAIGPAATLMQRGELDAFFVVAGVPSRVVAELTDPGAAALKPVAGAEIDDVLARHRFFSRSRIAAGSYEGQPAVDTIAVGAQWIISADVPDDLAYAICKSLWNDSTRELLEKGHPQGRHIRVATALDGIAIPLHPGAERCYRELGVLKP
jgi:uncharacterized protein